MEWLQANWINILAVVGALDGFLFLFSSLTPWKWDDNAYKIFHNIVSFFLPKK